MVAGAACKHSAAECTDVRRFSNGPNHFVYRFCSKSEHASTPTQFYRQSSDVMPTDHWPFCTPNAPVHVIVLM